MIKEDIIMEEVYGLPQMTKAEACVNLMVYNTIPELRIKSDSHLIELSHLKDTLELYNNDFEKIKEDFDRAAREIFPDSPETTYKAMSGILDCWNSMLRKEVKI